MPLLNAPEFAVVPGPEMAALNGVCLNPYPSALVNFMTIIIVLLLTVIAGVIAYYFYLRGQEPKKEAKEDFDNVAKEKADAAEKAQRDNVADYEGNQRAPEKSGRL